MVCDVDHCGVFIISSSISSMGGLRIAQPEVTYRAIHRIKIAKGHIEKVLTMVTDGAYCIDIIDQSKAVQHALKEVDLLLLENHLKTCVADIAKRKGTEHAIEEVTKVFRRH